MRQDGTKQAAGFDEQVGIERAERKNGQLLERVEVRHPQRVKGDVDVSEHENQGGDTACQQCVGLISQLGVFAVQEQGRHHQGAEQDFFTRAGKQDLEGKVAAEIPGCQREVKRRRRIAKDHHQRADTALQKEPGQAELKHPRTAKRHSFRLKPNWVSGIRMLRARIKMVNRANTPCQMW